MPSVFRAALASFLFAAAAPIATAQIAGLGAMGDSLTDEYAEESYGSYAANWLEQLEAYRGVNIGPTAEEAGAGDWGLPRRTGFEYNWALAGAFTDALLSLGEHTGVAEQAQAGKVSHAVLFIGANDFAPAIGLPYWWIYNGLWGKSTIDDFVNSRADNIRQATETVLASGAKLILVNVVDYSLAPGTWQDGNFSDPSKRDRVSSAIASLNQKLDALAKEKQIVLVDFGALGAAMFGNNHDLHEFLPIGGVNIKLWETDTPQHGNPTAAFVDDGIHPNTTLQGIVANVIAMGLDMGYNSGIEPFRESEILAHAGLEYGGADTLEELIGPYSNYVRDYTVKPCYPDFTADGALDLFDFLAFVNAFNAGDSAADCIADGALDLFDFLCFVNAFNAGC